MTAPDQHQNRKPAGCHLPRLVAHRGYPYRYPENTLPGITAALAAGASHIEVDVQLSTDGVPMLFHDVSLARTTGRAGNIMDLDCATLSRIPAGEPRRFGRRFAHVTIPTLAALAELLGTWPAAEVFVEIKTESLARFGTQAVVTAVMAAVEPLGMRAIPISYAAEALQAARRRGARRVGWVLSRPDAAHRRQAEALRPDYLFCNHTRLKPGPEALWSGPWAWVLYEIADARLALDWHARGARYIETMAVGELLRQLASMTGSVPESMLGSIPGSILGSTPGTTSGGSPLQRGGTRNDGDE